MKLDNGLQKELANYSEGVLNSAREYFAAYRRHGDVLAEGVNCWPCILSAFRADEQVEKTVLELIKSKYVEESRKTKLCEIAGSATAVQPERIEWTIITEYPEAKNLRYKKQMLSTLGEIHKGKGLLLSVAKNSAHAALRRQAIRSVTLQTDSLSMSELEPLLNEDDRVSLQLLKRLFSKWMGTDNISAFVRKGLKSPQRRVIENSCEILGYCVKEWRKNRDFRIWATAAELSGPALLEIMASPMTNADSVRASAFRTFSTMVPSDLRDDFEYDPSAPVNVRRIQVKTMREETSDTVSRERLEEIVGNERNSTGPEATRSISEDPRNTRTAQSSATPANTTPEATRASLPPTKSPSSTSRRPPIPSATPPPPSTTRRPVPSATRVDPSRRPPIPTHDPERSKKPTREPHPTYSDHHH
ncbi:MAG: hypothetical protein U5N86_10100 [Planctomycetota bacterium]|nr:hypothetical protein [Planctomycetota bacterium]